jgi:hypothetical protein
VTATRNRGEDYEEGANASRLSSGLVGEAAGLAVPICCCWRSGGERRGGGREQRAEGGEQGEAAAEAAVQDWRRAEAAVSWARTRARQRSILSCHGSAENHCLGYCIPASSSSAPKLPPTSAVKWAPAQTATTGQTLVVVFFFSTSAVPVLRSARPAAPVLHPPHHGYRHGHPLAAAPSQPGPPPEQAG